MTATRTVSPLAAFCNLVLSDTALALDLYRATDTTHFVELALAAAKAHAIGPAEDVLRELTLAGTPDPLGLSRWTLAPVRGDAWPGPGWLPIQVGDAGDGIVVDWAFFGDTPLCEPFFEDSIRNALARPINRVLRYRTRLDCSVAGHGQGPSGFIFHMSRCGSTLVSQMLAAVPRHKVISEAPPIDVVVRGSFQSNGQHLSSLSSIIRAYSSETAGRKQHTFIKLDSWHVLALPLFRRAFPTVPWVFLYRDPVEVLVSQMRQRGIQMVPDIVPPQLYGIDDFNGLPNDDYCARVLGRICRAAADHYSLGGGLLVNYDELPSAVWTKIVPHFQIAVDEEDRDIMAAAAQRDAKAPSFAFSPDREGKQRDATQNTRAVADTHLGGVYRQLEDLRRGNADFEGT